MVILGIDAILHTDMYGYYPGGYPPWTPSPRGYLQNYYSNTPLPYAQAGLYDTSYYDQPFYMDYNGLVQPYPSVPYGGQMYPYWNDYGQPYIRDGLLGTLFGPSWRRRRSSSLYSKLSREQLQEEQLRQLRRQSNSSSHKSSQRHHHNDSKKRT